MYVYVCCYCWGLRGDSCSSCSLTAASLQLQTKGERRGEEVRRRRGWGSERGREQWQTAVSKGEEKKEGERTLRNECVCMCNVYVCMCMKKRNIIQLINTHREEKKKQKKKKTNSLMKRNMLLSLSLSLPLPLSFSLSLSLLLFILPSFSFFLPNLIYLIYLIYLISLISLISLLVSQSICLSFCSLFFSSSLLSSCC